MRFSSVDRRLTFAILLLLLVSAGAPAQNFTPRSSVTATSGSEPVAASASTEYQQPQYLGAYRPDGRFRAVSNSAQDWERTFDEPNDVEMQRDLPPSFHVRSSETVVENFEPPAHASERSPRQSLLVTVRDSIITFAYGRERVFRTPTHIATDSKQRLIISDPGLVAVHVIDPAGKTSFRIVGGDQRRLRSPNGVAIDGDDNIYVADGKLGLVGVFNPEGHFLRFLGIFRGESMFDSPTAIAIDQKSGRLYVLDTTANELIVLDLQGNLLKRVGGPRGLNNIKLRHPSEIAIRNGRVVVLDGYGSRIHILDTDCNLVNSFDVRNPNAAPVQGEVGLALDGSSNIYISNLLSPTIRVYRPDGQALGFLGSHDSPRLFNLPLGLWVDSADRLFVTNGAHAQVQLFQIAQRRHLAEAAVR